MVGIGMVKAAFVSCNVFRKILIFGVDRFPVTGFSGIYPQIFSVNKDCQVF